MAAALAIARRQRRVHARSAGTAPAAELELALLEVMAEIGVDLTDELVTTVDRIITLGRGGAGTPVPSVRHLGGRSWPCRPALWTRSTASATTSTGLYRSDARPPESRQHPRRWGDS
jgi:hypothetical protein